MIARATIFIYGIFYYPVFPATFLYALGFVGDLYVPESIDSGVQGSLPAALPVDTALLGLFAVRHSLTARPLFKRAWTRAMPEPDSSRCRGPRRPITSFPNHEKEQVNA